MEQFDIGLISIAITELVKQYGIPSKYASLLCVILSIGLSILVSPKDIVTALIDGLVAGLVATGLYGATKNIIKK